MILQKQLKSLPNPGKMKKFAGAVIKRNPGARILAMPGHGGSLSVRLCNQTIQ